MAPGTGRSNGVGLWGHSLGERGGGMRLGTIRRLTWRGIIDCKKKRRIIKKYISSEMHIIFSLQTVHKEHK